MKTNSLSWNASAGTRPIGTRLGDESSIFDGFQDNHPQVVEKICASQIEQSFPQDSGENQKTFESNI